MKPARWLCATLIALSSSLAGGAAAPVGAAPVERLATHATASAVRSIQAEAALPMLATVRVCHPSTSGTCSIVSTAPTRRVRDWRRGWPRIGHRPRDRRGPRWDYLCRKRAGRRSPVHRHPTARPATRPGVGRRSQQVTPTQSAHPGQCVRTQQTPPAGCASRAGSPCDCWVRSPSRSS